MYPQRERKPNRLKGFDYSSPGIYFVTICTYQRAYLLGEVTRGKMVMNNAGKIVQQVWNELPVHYSDINIDHFIIMPNHIHGLIKLLEPNVGDGFKPSTAEIRHSHGLSEIVRGFKSFSARRVNNVMNSKGVPLWQRSFYDRIIRSDDEHYAVIQYIQDNPKNWQEDEDNIR